MSVLVRVKFEISYEGGASSTLFSQYTMVTSTKMNMIYMWKVENEIPINQKPADLTSCRNILSQYTGLKGWI